MMQNFEVELFEAIDGIFNPRSIAVVGASDNPLSFGYMYLHYVRDSGYGGKLYAVNPKYKEILDIETYPTIDTIPGDVDFVISCVNAELVIGLLEQCSKKNVKAMHLFTGRLGETGDLDACRLEKLILEKAKQTGVRLIGPNCMGIYCPKQGIIFNYDLTTEPGHVGFIVQSGGLAGEFVRLASLRGVRFSKSVSYGNGLDLNECDFMDYFFHDPETKIVALYIEGTRDGQRFIPALRRLAGKKPVVVLKGGRAKAGIKAAASHTATIAGASDLWENVFRQCNVLKASGMEELINLTVAFSRLPHIKGKKVLVVGGGGGKSVLSADEAEEAGLSVANLPEEIRNWLKLKEPKLADWLGNPVDFSILVNSSVSASDIMSRLSKSEGIDVIIANVTEDNPFEGEMWVRVIRNEVNDYIKVSQNSSKPIVVVFTNPPLDINYINNFRWEAVAEQRKRLLDAGIPVFSSVRDAASAIIKTKSYYDRNA